MRYVGALSRIFFCICYLQLHKKSTRAFSLSSVYLLSLSVTRALIHDVVDNAGTAAATTTTAK